MVRVYRGTSNVAEQAIHEETGHLLSEAARQGYIGSGSLEGAYSAASATHQQWLGIWEIRRLMLRHMALLDQNWDRRSDWTEP
jgi:hypothetical protein